MFQPLPGEPGSPNPTAMANAYGDLFSSLGYGSDFGQSLFRAGMDPEKYLALEEAKRSSLQNSGIAAGESANRLGAATAAANASEYNADQGVFGESLKNAALLQLQGLKNTGEMSVAKLKAQQNIQKLLGMVLPFLMPKQSTPKIPDAAGLQVFTELQQNAKKNPATASNPIGAAAQAYGRAVGPPQGDGMEKLLPILMQLQGLGG